MSTTKKKDDTLEVLFPSNKTIETSVGALEFSPYKLKHIAKITRYVSDISQAIQIKNIDELKSIGIENINFSYLLYTLGVNESECLMDLLSCCTGKDKETLGELSDQESIEAMKLTFEVALIPLFKRLGNELKGLKVKAQ